MLFVILKIRCNNFYEMFSDVRMLQLRKVIPHIFGKKACYAQVEHVESDLGTEVDLW